MNNDGSVANRPGVFAGLFYRVTVWCCVDFSGYGRTIFTEVLACNVAFGVVIDACISLLLHSSLGPYAMITVIRLLSA